MEVLDTSLTNEQMLTLFLSKIKLNGFSLNTQKGYKFELQTFFKDVNKHWSEINFDDLELYFSGLMDIRKKTTVSRRMAALKGYFKYIEERYEDFKNPTKKLHSPKLDKRLPKFLTPIEIELLLSQIKNLRNLTVVTLFWVTGMRINELFKLNKEDVNFENKSVKVFGKGSKERVTYFNDTAAELLKQYIDSRTDENPALFIEKGNRRLSERTIQKFVVKYAKLAGIKKHVTPHSLRHSYATQLIRNHVPLEIIQRSMGHSQMTTTLIYANLDDQSVVDAYRSVFDKKD
jgi:integrase/recombinase XerD